MVAGVSMAFAEEQKLKVHWQVEEHCELQELCYKIKDKINKRVDHRQGNLYNLCNWHQNNKN